MSNIKAAVVSGNAQLRRFFELELACMGIDVSCVADTSELHTGYDILFVDTDTVKFPNGIYSAPTVSVSALCTDRAEEGYFLGYPSSVEDIRSVTLRIMTSDDPRLERTLESPDTVYVLDEAAGRVMLEDRSVSLSKKELTVLFALCEGGGAVISRERIMDALGTHEGNIADVYVCRLRKKLEASNGRRLIFTERGLGYRTQLKIKNVQ